MLGKKHWGWILSLCLGAAVPTVATADRRPGRAGNKPAAVRQARDRSPRATVLRRRPAGQPQRINIESASVRSFGRDGNTAGTAIPPGTTVYRNEINLEDPDVPFYTPGAFQIMADDLKLAAGACEVVYYNLMVFGDGAPGSPATYDVHTALWNGDPCDGRSSVIAGTERDFRDLANDRTLWLLEAFLDASPVAVPETVWLEATFSIDNAGWIVAEEAEVGSTNDLWSENDTDPRPGFPNGFGCTLLFFGPPPQPYAGFWANVNCNVAGEQPGACCDGTSCREVTEAQCNGFGETWQGAFTTCDPNPCQPGACCTGINFGTCIDTTEAGCSGDLDLFHPGAACADNVCPIAFKAYENDFITGLFDAMAPGAKWADDLLIAPCDLVAFDLKVVGAEGSPDYNVQVELWSNDDAGTPDEDDDIPLAPITGTQADFTGVPADQTPHTLLAGPFPRIPLPDRVWLVFSVSSNEATPPEAGPLLGGMANIGVSRDGFAVIDDPDFPASLGVWLGGIWYLGFIPDGCPFDPNDPTCVAAGSFHIDLWCQGDPPTGACCNDAAGTCVDGVIEQQCDGPWAMGATCDSAPFARPCGSGACCSILGCLALSRVECEQFGQDFGMSVAFAPGKLCADVVPCPATRCLDATGDCFAPNTTAGCDDAFCCDAVCMVDDGCCVGPWDTDCMNTAGNLCELTVSNDHCVNAEPIRNIGDFEFDNSIATTDGAPHAGCLDLSEQNHIRNDVWYCWTSPCNDIVSVQTCDLTTVDTKIAVYEGCGLCSPTDAELLACNDDSCSPASQGSTVLFNASVGQSYLIRIGTWPGAEGGAGQFSISCGVPQDDACPGTGDCCAANGSVGCDDPTCCDKVCACDPQCCDGEWDEACAGTGREGTGCGARTLCAESCGICPDTPISWEDPLDGAVDARQPYPPENPGEPGLQGFRSFRVRAPATAAHLECWTLCETRSLSSDNVITDVQDMGDGTLMLTLARPITPNAVTKITYQGNGTAGTFISHSGNTNGDGFADATDVSHLIDCVQGASCELWQCDADHSSRCAPGDLPRVIDLLMGGAPFDPMLGTALPRAGAICP